MIKKLKEKFQKCFELAVQGETLAFPNPNVACLIYFQEELVSYGVHRKFGKAHAEVNAIESLKQLYESNSHGFKSFEDFAAECELILNLEPCCHYGNTPPCSQLIKESGFKKISFAAYDTNPKVFKKSLEIFKEEDGYTLIKPEELDKDIQEQAQFVNRVFFSIKEKESKHKLPVWLSLKIASYADADMLTKEGSDWITGEKARQDVHRLRSINQLLITTSKTIKADNPSYNVRHSAEKLELLDTKDPDLCALYNQEKIELPQIASDRKVIYERVSSLEKDSLEKLIKKLNFQGYQKIMIEAGPSLSKAFIDSGLVDELIIYQPVESRAIKEFKEDVNKHFKVQAKDFNFYTKEIENDFKAILIKKS